MEGNDNNINNGCHNSDAVLVIGSGGREHCLAWCLAKFGSVKNVFCAPGNGGTENVEVKTNRNEYAYIQNVNINIAPTKQEKQLDSEEQEKQFSELIGFCRKESIQLVVVGPEGYLNDGIIDVLLKRNICCFGPTQQACRLESSKSFSKQFMQKHGIPTARFGIFGGQKDDNTEEVERAIQYVRFMWLDRKTKVVVKASGLCAGKGVIIPSSLEEAEKAIIDCLVNVIFGVSGQEIVIEERLFGVEASVFALCDGRNVFCLPPCQDYKRAYDGDMGPNTGGMGAICPSPAVDAHLMEIIKVSILQRTVDAMSNDGIEFVGCLFAGLIITDHNKVFVLEFNVRFGDPEIQCLLPLYDDVNLFKIFKLCASSYNDAKNGKSSSSGNNYFNLSEEDDRKNNGNINYYASKKVCPLSARSRSGRKKESQGGGEIEDEDEDENEDEGEDQGRRKFKRQAEDVIECEHCGKEGGDENSEIEVESEMKIIEFGKVGEIGEFEEVTNLGDEKETNGEIGKSRRGRVESEYGIASGNGDRGTSGSEIIGAESVNLLEEECRRYLRFKTYNNHNLHSVCVVLASKGYPNSFEKGFPIYIQNRKLQELCNLCGNCEVYLFHAGTKRKKPVIFFPQEDDKWLLRKKDGNNNNGNSNNNSSMNECDKKEDLLASDCTLDELAVAETTGGRVMSVVAIAEDLNKARNVAYQAVQCISFENMYYRTDIGIL